MDDFPIKVGQTASFSKTIGESDVYLFAGITGDLSPNHVNSTFMEKTRYRQRIVHGALLVGFLSNCSTRIIDGNERHDATPVSLGYDRIRFLKPVFIGDTITVTYEITSIEPDKQRSIAACSIHNQYNELVLVATHIMKWVANA